MNNAPYLVTVTGASDDLIEVDGEVQLEVDAYNTSEKKPYLVALSTGTLLSVFYGHGGIWRVLVLDVGSASVRVETGSARQGGNDVATVASDKPITWCVAGEGSVAYSKPDAVEVTPGAAVEVVPEVNDGEH